MIRMRRRHWVRLGQLAFALCLMALLWRHFDGEAALGLLATADPGWLFAAFFALTLQTLLSALRWRFTARQLGQILRFGHALREYYLAQFANQVLPGGMIGDAGRAFRARENGGLVTSSQAVLFERLSGQVMLFLVMLAGLFLASLGQGSPLLTGRILSIAVPVAAVCLVALVLLWLVPALPGRIGRAFGSLRSAITRAFLGWHVLPRQVALSLGATLCNLLAFAFCAHATGTVLTPFEIMVLVPLILYAMVVPLTVSGWGIREGVAAALFPFAGASAAAGLAASTAFGLVFLASTVPGVFVLMTRARPADDRASEGPPVPSGLPSGNPPLS